MSRYLLLTGGVYWIFYSVLGKQLEPKRLRRSPPSLKFILRDIRLAALSAVIFGLGSAFVLSSYDVGMTRLYTDLSQYGLWYLGFSFVVVLILQDAYFYAVHRAFHHPLIFKWMHYGHHRSGDPTPWSSFAFDPPEAVVQALFFVAIVFVVPLHFFILIAVLMAMTGWSIWNHLGYELFPASFSSHWLGKWFIGSTHHAVHHRRYAVHYGLYFTLWDRVFKTQDPNYESQFDLMLK